MTLRARHYRTGEPTELRVADGRIVSTGPATADGVSGWVAPALFDLQVNGCDGVSFNAPTLTVEQIRHVVEVGRRHGVGGLLPTLVTNSYDALAHGLATLRRAVETDSVVRAAVPGFHVEGPYISPEDGPRGAHPRDHVRPPDWDEFRRLQEAAGGLVRLLTLAPERPEALPFIEKLAATGVVVALGHTAADGPTLRAAVAAGARLSTHLGNGCHAVMPRHDNPVWEQLAGDELWASVIADGHHLPPAVLRCILRVKTPARTVLTCDASSLAGRPPGRYREWGQDLEVRPEGRVVLSGTPYLAGSAVFTDTCVAHAARVGGVSLADAIDMAGARPRELLGLPRRELAVGEPADVWVFDRDADGRVMTRKTGA
jgi:N-acetylglucosamine-6-phosphate deacetylase